MRSRKKFRRNPPGWDTDVRSLLREMTGDTWKGGQPVPESWRQPYLSRRPEWTPLRLTSKYFNLSELELLEKIKPEIKKLSTIEGVKAFSPDAELRFAYYEYVKDFLQKNGRVDLNDVVRIAKEIGLDKYADKSPKNRYVHTSIVRRLMKEGLATLISPTGFKGNIYYEVTPKLLTESPEERVRRQAQETEEFERELALERQREEAEFERELELERQQLAALEQLDLPIATPVEDNEEVARKPVRYAGDPNKILADIVRDYNLRVEQGTKHKLIRMPDNGMVSVPGTPSDWRSMKNCVGDVKRYLKRLGVWEGAKEVRRNPWSARDVIRHNKKCAKKGKCRNKWSKIANAVLRGSGDEGKAVRIANWQVKRMGLNKNPAPDKSGVIFVYNSKARKKVTECLKIAGFVHFRSPKADKYPRYEYRGKAALIHDGDLPENATSRFLVTGDSEDLEFLGSVLNSYAKDYAIDYYL